MFAFVICALGSGKTTQIDSTKMMLASSVITIALSLSCHSVMAEEEFCSKADENCEERTNQLSPDVFDCDKSYETKIPLRQIEDFWANRPKMFFIESSGRPHLKARQACSVESAIRNANGREAGDETSRDEMSFVVVMTSSSLDLSHNATCQLYRKYSESKLFFRTVDKASIFKDTALQDVYESGRLDNSPTPVVHYR